MCIDWDWIYLNFTCDHSLLHNEVGYACDTQFSGGRKLFVSSLVLFQGVM